MRSDENGRNYLKHEYKTKHTAWKSGVRLLLCGIPMCITYEYGASKMVNKKLR